MAMTTDTVMVTVMTMMIIVMMGTPDLITGAIIIDQVMDRDLIIGGEIKGS